MQIDFMLIGAQKSGTTSLAYQLAQHPQICFCRTKEPHHFSKSIDWNGSLDEYHKLFDPYPGQICGEASTTYTWLPQYPDTANRLHTYNPNLKLLYLMRQPVERIVSHYTHRLLRGRTKSPKEAEVLENPIYVNRSRYAVQIRPYLELYNRENILLIIFEEYVKNQIYSLKEIAAHLGIEPNGFDGIENNPQYQSLERKGDKKIKTWLTPLSRLFPLRIRNALRGPFVYGLESKPEFSYEFKKLLWRFVIEDVQEIERIIERPLDIWHYHPYFR